MRFWTFDARFGFLPPRLPQLFNRSNSVIGAVCAGLGLVAFGDFDFFKIFIVSLFIHAVALETLLGSSTTAKIASSFRIRISSPSYSKRWPAYLRPLPNPLTAPWPWAKRDLFLGKHLSNRHDLSHDGRNVLAVLGIAGKDDAAFGLSSTFGMAIRRW